MISCSSSEKKDSSRNAEYVPAYQAHGAFNVAVADIGYMLFANPQGIRSEEKDMIVGKCKIVSKDSKKEDGASELCNGVEVFLYTTDGRILQRTWAHDGAYRFKVATEGPYTVKAKYAPKDFTVEWEGVRRGQILNLQLVQK